MIIVENETRAVRALIGSSGTDVPGGWLDLTNAVRSPGSALKPFIYAMAFEDGSLNPESVINDLPRTFGGYSPENFDRTFRGEVRIKEALQHSLNVPAVAALEKIGSARFKAALSMAGTALQTPNSKTTQPGLALALGGTGLRMREMATLYAALATDGTVKPLHYLASTPSSDQSYQLFSQETASSISQILRNAPSLKGRAPAALTKEAPDIAFKTGTSWGFRDAWAAGFNDQYTVIIWIGRADGAPRPGKTGRNTAAPLLFSTFDMLGYNEDILTALKHPSNQNAPFIPANSPARNVQSLPPQITFPRDGIEVFLDPANKTKKGFALTSSGGKGKTKWYVDGHRIKQDPIGERHIWYPNKEGFYLLAVVDEIGQTSTITIRVRSHS